MPEVQQFTLDVPQDFSDAERVELEAAINGALKQGETDERGRCNLEFGEPTVYALDPETANVLIAALSGSGAVAIVLTRLIVEVSRFFRERDRALILRAGSDKEFSVSAKALRDPNATALLLEFFKSIGTILRPEDADKVKALVDQKDAPPRPVA